MVISSSLPLINVSSQMEEADMQLRGVEREQRRLAEALQAEGERSLRGAVQVMTEELRSLEEQLACAQGEGAAARDALAASEARGGRMVRRASEEKTRLAEEARRRAREGEEARASLSRLKGEAAAKARMPKAEIARTLEAEILPRYSQCFVQLHEEAAPTGQDLDSWLKQVTMEMQASIEQHLTGVFRSRSL
ncbi:MAG: hypothetical protein SGPRY_010778 [Prymnesium sp.]